jgi:hypothetical protein
MNTSGGSSNHPGTTQSTRSSLRQREFGARFLKQADAFLRIGNIPGALDAVKAARDADPSNPYCGAYIERIRQLLLREETEDPNDEPEHMRWAETDCALGL